MTNQTTRIEVFNTITRLRIKKKSMKKNFELSDAIKFVKNYENAIQKIVTLLDKLSTINVDIDQKKSERFSKLSITIFKSLIIIVDTPSTFNQKRKFERSSKLSTTVFKSLIIIDDSSIVAASFSIFSNITPISTKSFVSISIIVSTTFNSKFSTNIFLLVSIKQRLIVVIFFKQVSIDSIFSTVARKFFVLK